MNGPVRASSVVGLGGWLRALRQTVIIAAITIVLCEIGLRAFNYVYPLQFFYSSSYNRFRVKPHASFQGFELNSRGFNDVEFKIDKEPGVFRILGIGDSFAFGIVPYRFNYLTLIEQRLNAGGARSELINMGIPGTSPREYLALLLHEGLELKPDMVLLSFFVGNDFTEARKVDRLYRYSYLASLGKYVFDLNTRMANINLTTSGDYDDARGYHTDASYIELAHSLSGIFRKDSKSFESLLANTVTHLDNIRRVCERHGIRLAVVLIPDEMQVDPTLQRQVIEASGLAGEAFDFDLPNERLKDQLARLRIDYIDLLQPMREATAHARLYRRNDTHWNIKGNAFAAETILGRLRPLLPSSAGR
jgi:SGNH hydrolase-like domain, acetyltransferase AlgX